MTTGELSIEVQLAPGLLQQLEDLSALLRRLEAQGLTDRLRAEVERCFEEGLRGERLPAADAVQHVGRLQLSVAGLAEVVAAARGAAEAAGQDVSTSHEGPHG